MVNITTLWYIITGYRFCLKVVLMQPNYFSMKSQTFTNANSTRNRYFLLLLFIGSILLNTTLLQKSHAKTYTIYYADEYSLSNVDGHVYGKVTSESGDPLPGVNIHVDGSSKGATTDASGKFDLQLPEGRYTLRISFVGYQTTNQEITVNGTDQTINITLQETLTALNEVVVLGSRSSTNRSNIDKPVPVDVIAIKEVKGYAQNDITQILNYNEPSFSSNRQAVADGTDHIDPASLRGLGPDQVLVLVNGKRRHASALVNINGTFGRGTVGTDMNSIPVAATERIEVLRDGAAAQYGSDAIAGVINIVLKKNSPLTISSTYGQSASNTLGRSFNDGKTFQFDLSKGFALGDKGSINFGGQFLYRGATDRQGPDTRPLLYSAAPTKGATETEAEFQNRYTELKTTDDTKAIAEGLDRNTMRVGNSESTNAGFFINGEYALSPKANVYLATGLTNKKGEAAGFYRLPFQSAQVDVTLYPNGFLPLINTNITDFSTIAGVRGNLGKWNYDVSNTYGQNSIAFEITNSMNASLPAGTSPKEFDAGKLTFMQNTFNVDFARKFDFTSSFLTSLNMGYGAELRLDNYQIEAGEELSYSYGQPSQDIAGLAGKAAGAQVFPGFKPSNVLDKSRNNKGLYADFEGEFGPRVLISLAGRYENYSDFGSNFSYKVAGRLKLFREFSIRGGAATGFRAPSLHQHYFNNESTQFVQGLPTQVLTVNNDNNIVRQFGVGPLKPEISTSYSLGITGELFETLNLSIDAYQIDIDNRIVFSSQYARERAANGDQVPTGTINQILNTVDPNAFINSVQFFTNAITTRTKGIDVVISDKIRVGQGSLILTAASNFNETKVRTIFGTEVIENNATLKAKLFDRLERSRYESSVPKSKITLSANYNLKKLGILLRTVRFGEVTFLNAVDPTIPTNNLPLEIDQTFSAKWITDISISYKILSQLNLTLGANNLFDVYPDKAYIDPRNHQFNFSSDPANNYTTVRDNTSNGHFMYSRNVTQFGFNGRYVFARLTFQL
jgi:iron complex outermembrane receptor protein